jgi:hypothetical protein
MHTIQYIEDYHHYGILSNYFDIGNWGLSLSHDYIESSSSKIGKTHGKSHIRVEFIPWKIFLCWNILMYIICINCCLMMISNEESLSFLAMTGGSDATFKPRPVKPKVLLGGSAALTTSGAQKRT